MSAHGIGEIKTAFYSRHCMAVLCFLLVMTGCGYRFAGGGDLPGGVRRLSVGVFENKTREKGLEAQIANDLIYQFTRYDNIKLTDRSRSEGHLTGVIRSARVTTVTHASANVSAERRIQVVMDVKLTAPDGRLIWSGDAISAYETYEVASDKSTTEQNKKSALTTLSSKVAERIYYRLTDNF